MFKMFIKFWNCIISVKTFKARQKILTRTNTTFEFTSKMLTLFSKL